MGVPRGNKKPTPSINGSVKGETMVLWTSELDLAGFVDTL